MRSDVKTKDQTKAEDAGMSRLRTRERRLYTIGEGRRPGHKDQGREPSPRAGEVRMEGQRNEIRGPEN